MTKLHLICDGDSWTFGSEIADPALIAKHPPDKHITSYDWSAPNDIYRKQRIFPHYLGKLLNAEKVTNLAWPADDNLTILRRTIAYITNNYISKNIPTDNLLVVIGWSTPERTHFWFKDENFNHIFRVRPNYDGNFETKGQEEFWKLYVQYIWNPEQYVVDYIFILQQFQNFCKMHNINWLCFNAFYQTSGKGISQWVDFDCKKETEKLVRGTNYKYQIIEDDINQRKHETYDYVKMWDLVDPLRFYKKDEAENTFKSFIWKIYGHDAFSGLHPNEKSHLLWAKELYRYIKEHKIIDLEKFI